MESKKIETTETWAYFKDFKIPDYHEIKEIITKANISKNDIKTEVAFSDEDWKFIKMSLIYFSKEINKNRITYQSYKSEEKINKFEYYINVYPLYFNEFD